MSETKNFKKQVFICLKGYHTNRRQLKKALKLLKNRKFNEISKFEIHFQFDSLDSTKEKENRFFRKTKQKLELLSIYLSIKPCDRKNF